MFSAKILIVFFFCHSCNNFDFSSFFQLRALCDRKLSGENYYLIQEFEKNEGNAAETAEDFYDPKVQSKIDKSKMDFMNSFDSDEDEGSDYAADR